MFETNEQIERQIDLECAEEGVALLPRAPEPPREVSGKPNVDAYSLRIDLWFKDRAEAENALKLLQRYKRYRPYYLRGEYTYSGPQGLEEVDVEEETISSGKFWTADHYSAHRADLERFSKEKAVFDKENEEYKKLVKARQAIANDVWDRVYRERREREQLQSNRELFAEYVDLADGDREKAWAFMVKAKPELENDKDAILSQETSD